MRKGLFWAINESDHRYLIIFAVECDRSGAVLAGQSPYNSRKLEVFNVYGSSVTALPETIGNLNALKELHIGATAISYLSDTLCRLTNLEFFI